MSFITKNIIPVFALFFSLFLASCGQKSETVAAEDTRPTVSVKLTKAGDTDTPDFLNISGKIQAENYANVSAQMMGHITNVSVNVGDNVRQGQILATISSKDIQAKIAQVDAGILEAKVALKNTEKDYDRINTLHQKNSATQKELDDITAGRDMMKAKLQQAQEMKNEVNTMLAYAKVKAPFNGSITEKMVNSGDMASPGKPLFTIEAAGDFIVEAMIPESQVTSIAKGDDVKVIIKSSGKQINGKISEFSSSSRNSGGQYLSKISLDKKDLKEVKLYSGMYANVLLPNKKSSNDAASGKVMVNKSAVVTQGQLTGIYTPSDNNTAILRWVRLGKSYGEQVEVLSGLNAGENYISDFDSRLSNGVKIVING